MSNLFHYKVFRYKIIITTTGILLIAALIFAVSYSFLRAGWINAAREESLRQGRLIERNLQNEDDLLSLQITGVYASTQLVDDILGMFHSRTFDDYMTSRLARSRSTSADIRSFPEYIRAYIRRHGSFLNKMILHGDGFTHVIHFGRGEIEYEFGAAPKPSFGIQDGFEIRKMIYNPSDNYTEIGEVSFIFGVEDIVSGNDFPGFTFAALRDISSNLYNLKNKTLNNSRIPEKGAFVQELGQFPYQLVTYADNAMLIKENFMAISVLVIVMAILTVASILFLAYSIRYDLLFIKDILFIINEMKRGVFQEASGTLEARYSRNEYGIIAQELGDLSLKLKRHIQAEYELKIKQQQTEMRLLQNQINPHFLYNTLEAISAQALLNHDRPTSDAITAMGALFRDMACLPPQISMKEETQILKTYLKVMEFKSAGGFCYHVDLLAELEDFPTVKFWLQPLCENFFNHGYDPSNPYNLLIVRVYRDSGDVCVDIADNGAHLPEDTLRSLNDSLRLPETPESGIGMRNVYSRLSMFYGNGLSMRIANGEESGIIIRVRMQGGESH